ncbi:hypothetical protein ACLOJK_021919, partial [Asimina triloba]
VAVPIPGANSNSSLAATPPLEEISVMDNEMASEFIVDQGPYYPAAANYYGYYCTGFESPREWDDHHRFFGLDGPDLHYTVSFSFHGVQTENLPYVYYTPSYGYAQSPYNPYNPYIPGAVVGVDGPLVGTQQYYTGPGYQHPVSSPAYFPVIVQSSPDAMPSTLEPTMLNLGVSSANRTDGTGFKHASPPASMGLGMSPPAAASGDVRTDSSQITSHQTPYHVKISEGSRAGMGPSKLSVSHGSNASSTVPNLSSPNVTQGRSASSLVQPVNPSSFGRASTIGAPLKVTLPSGSGITEFGSNAHGWASVDKLRPRMQFNGVMSSGNGSPDVLGEQNRGPRTNRSKNPWPSSISVKAYTTKAGTSNAQGNIVIYADQYNREDFPVNYPNAKFFVIKSYSEDDVHKSIKYNVWSSTPSGNKRLDSAYEEAQRISGGRPGTCPVFLFFSVNASGQFCGVAEMIGPVDFQKDMDFWQQDKWTGSFPVKWHIIKDVPNANFRHIILENNENKPVTNSRDTQEVRYMEGMGMLSIFKNYSQKMSILDDFMYYEDRQKLMQAEKSRLLGKTYDASFFLSSMVPPTLPNFPANQPTKADEKPTRAIDLSGSGKVSLVHEKIATEKISQCDEKVVMGKTAAINVKVIQGKLSPSDEKVVSGKTTLSNDKVASGKTGSSVEKVSSGQTHGSNVEKVSSGQTHSSNEKVILGKVAAGKPAPSAEKVVSKFDAINPSSPIKDSKDELVEGVNDALRIGSLSLGLKDVKEDNTNNNMGPVIRSTAPMDVVTVGSVPIKVNGYGESSSGLLTVGSISIDPKAVKINKPAIAASNVQGS